MLRPTSTTIGHVLAALLSATLASSSAPGIALAAGAAAEKAPNADGARKPKPKASTTPDPTTHVSPVVEACVDHHTDAQELRMAGKLLESRDAMRQCAAERCPALLQRDCVGWLEQVQAQLPSITFRVLVDGQSRSDGRVFIDGVEASGIQKGKAIELNPGPHHLRFVVAGIDPHEEDVTLNEGERYRMVEVSLTSPHLPQPKAPEMHRPVPIETYILGGVALAGAVSGGFWAASSTALRQDLEDDCAPDCPERRINQLRTRALITDVSWGVSALSIIGATTFFLLRPELPVEVDVAWLPDGGGMGTLRIDTF